MPIALKAPLSNKIIEKLKAGDQVLISGTIYVARDAAHQRFKDHPPFPTEGQILFYASPTPTPPNKIIGSIGPTTASRMDGFLEPLLKLGLKATMGKGSRSPEIINLLKEYKAVYLLVPGGIAALLSKHVKQAKVIAYPDLGPEAILELEVLNFPALVAIDAHGGSLWPANAEKTS
jgi:fumarate hydratase subunit beta